MIRSPLWTRNLGSWRCIESGSAHGYPGVVTETNIGFDLRVDYASGLLPSSPTSLPETERYQFSDSSTPRSVSPTVWPRLLPDLWWDTAELSFEAASGLPCNLEEMAALVECLDVRNSSCLIAITVVEPSRNSRAFSTQDLDTVPRVPETSWRLLGYDVAERSLRSALSCFDWGADWPRIREQWSGAVNRSNLFDSSVDAQEYAGFVNEIVMDHGPFQVLGVWEISY